IRLDDALKIVDLPLPPALHRSRIKPSNPDQHVHGAYVILGRERGLRSLGDSIGKPSAIFRAHTRILRRTFVNNMHVWSRDYARQRPGCIRNFPDPHTMVRPYCPPHSRSFVFRQHWMLSPSMPEPPLQVRASPFLTHLLSRFLSRAFLSDLMRFRCHLFPPGWSRCCRETAQTSVMAVTFWSYGWKL